MIPILYEATEKKFETLGIGALSETISCQVVEEFNGEYELELTYPQTGYLFDEIKNQRIILVQANEVSQTQPFRIYKITKANDGIITVNAQHISYDLNYIPVKPFEATGITNTLNGLITNSLVDNPFTTWSSITNNATTYTQSVPASVRSRLGGTSGSVLDRFGGVYEWDRFTIKLHLHRGSQTPVTNILYGVNLVDLQQEEEISNVFTGVLAYYESEEEVISSDIQYIENYSQYPNQRIFVFDASSEYDEAPSKETLNARAVSYINANNVGVPNVNLEVDFVALSQFKNYDDLASLEKIGIDDTVNIYFEKLGVNATAKVIRTEWNVLKERYEKIELGNAKASLSSTLLNIQSEAQGLFDRSKDLIDNAYSRHEEAQERLAQLVANSFGMFKSEVVMEDGSTQYYYHNKPEMSKSTTIYTVNSNGFFISSDGGKTWNAGIDKDGNAVMNMLDAIGINADWIKVGLLTDQKGLNYWNLDTGAFSLSATSTIGGSTLSSQLSSTISSANSYADSSAIAQAQSALNSAKSYADTGDSNTLSSSKSYADTVGSNTLKNANSETTKQVTQVLKDAKAYADSVGDSASASALQNAIDFVNAQAFTTIDQVNTFLTQSVVFNKLTNDGKLKGIFMQDGELYINASYLKTGFLSADMIRGGTLILGGNNNGNGTMQVQNASGTVIATINNTGIDVASNTKISTTGAITSKSLSLLNSSGTSYATMNTSGLNIGSGNTTISTTGKITTNNIEMTSTNGKFTINGSNCNFILNDDTKQKIIFGYGLDADGSKMANLGVGDSSNSKYVSMGNGRIVSESGSYYVGINLADGESALYISSKSPSKTLTRLNATNFNVYTNFTVSGTKSRQVHTKDYGDRLMYALETPSPMFEDIGESNLDNTGCAYIPLEAVFKETIINNQYQVFLQKYGEGDVWVEERHQAYFIVKGTPNISFGYRIVAKQIDYDQIRLEKKVEVEQNEEDNSDNIV